MNVTRPKEFETVQVRSFFGEQRRRQRLTLFFVVLGLVWMVIMGCLLVDVHANLFRIFDAKISQDTIRHWCLAASCVAVGLWGLVAVVLLTSGARVLPLLVGAHVARGIDKQVLENVVEEISIAAVEPTLNIRWHILESSSQNAFACGRSVKDGSIVVTRGLLDALNRNELQAVVAHEFAHLKNGDSQFFASALAFAWMVVGVCLAASAVLVIAVVALSLIILLAGKIAEGDDSGIVAIVAVLLGLSLFIGGLVYLTAYAFMLAILIGIVALGVKAASSSISQSREYLADACAAQWTRNPMALASALAKISGYAKIVNAMGGLVAPLWLEYPNAEKGDKLTLRLVSFLLNTHPSISRRLELLRQMAGSTVCTDGRWLTILRPNSWERTKEWGLPAFATIIALAIAVILIRDLFQI